MDKVIVSRRFMGILHMQVCAHKDATDEEILHVANRDNECGTSGGWMTVHRATDDERNPGPVQCEQEGNRHHLLVSC